MSVDHLCSSFLGSPVHNYVSRCINENSSHMSRRSETGASVKFLFTRKNQTRCERLWFSQFGRTNVEFPLRKLGLRSMYKVNCMKESFSKSRTLIRSFSPLWMEGLLLFRCSVFAAVISVVGMLVWYGQIKAREFVEARILPHVCLTLSEYLQREIDLGKVQRVSPLGISLQSCSIGPNGQEFSCGAVPKMKLRVRPFASLRRGKIVVDAVLSRPSVLVVQKEDFSWLGIPSYSEAGLQSHCSNEEGIDFRTKMRRAAREEAAARCAADRKEAARQAAEMGYIVPELDPISSDNDGFKDGASDSTDFPSSSSFYCMDEKVHRRDHHYMDMGIEYGLKHADLEKTFGVNRNSPWHAFWSRMITNPIMHSLKRKVSRKEISEVGFALKRRNLERSAVAALAYFRGQDGGKFSRPFTEQGTPPSAGGRDGAQVELAGEKDEKNGKVNASSHDENSASQSVFEPVFLEVGKNVKQEPVGTVYGQLRNNLNDINGNLEYSGNLRSHHHAEDKHARCETDGFSFVHEPFLMGSRKLNQMGTSGENSSFSSGVSRAAQISACDPVSGSLKRVGGVDPGASCNSLPDPMLEFLEDRSGGNRGDKCRVVSFIKLAPIEMHYLIPTWPISLKFQLPHISRAIEELLSNYLVSYIQKLKSHMSLKVEDIAAKLAEGVDEVQAEGIEKLLPVTLDSVYFTGGTLMLLGYGDREPREVENVNGHVKFKNHYGRVHVQLCGCCKVWRSDLTSKDGGWLSTDVFVDASEQKWHANLKIANFFAPLFERILDIPITWSKGRASGEVHICMSSGETFPSLHGQLDVNGLAFQIFDAPSCFSEIAASLCFRGQRAFLHDASGWFGDAPLEASGDFGLNPEEGEFHLMCQVQCVEANALMKTFKMKPLLFPVAGLVTAVFNCRGPLEAPVFVGSGLISKKTAHYSATEFPQSLASEAVIKNKEAGAVAAFDRIPLSHASVNFTFNTDNCVADLYGIRATLLDGGEIRGAGYAWICLEGEVDDSAMDVNLSGKLSSFEKVISRYLPGGNQLMPMKIGEINGETKLSGSLSRPRFDIKWAAPKAEESFNDARGDIIISHDSFIASSSSVAFDLYMKVQTSYSDEYYWLSRKESGLRNGASLTIEGVELDFRMRGFEFLNLISSYSFDSPRPMHLKATGRIKFQGKILKQTRITNQNVLGTDKNPLDIETVDSEPIRSFVGEVLLSGIKLNQLMLAPQLVGSLNISPKNIKLDASGRPDENLTIEVVGPLWPTVGDNLQKRTISAALQKGQLRASISYRPQYSANLEVRNLPLDELELASLRGTIQRVELQLNFPKRRGHGMLSVLHPKFSGMLGEALNVAARWSGDVITVEKTVLEQANSKYELQGEYVLPGIRDRYPSGKESDGFFKRAMGGHLGTVISSMGRWRMRLEVPGAEVAEMLPLARLLSRSTDPAVRSRSKDLFIHNLQSVGFITECLRELREEMRRHYTSANEVVLEDITLPGLAELKGRWHGSLDASGGGNGDTMADFDFHGEDWEWGTYKTQRVRAVGAYSNNDGLRLEKIFIQRDNATIHADGTLLGPKTNLHFAVLNFPVGLVPAVVQVIETSATDALHSLRHLLTPIKGILHMEGDLRGSIVKPECDVQVRLLDGAIGGIDLGRAEIVASVTSTSRFLFNANFEPIIQSGHVHIQGSVPVTSIQNNTLESEDKEIEIGRSIGAPAWSKEKGRRSSDEISEKVSRDRLEDGWDIRFAESLKGLNWNILDVGEVRVDADIKDGGMMLITALYPYADWLHGNADIALQVRGTVEQPLVDGAASFHRASVSSPVLREPLTNLAGSIHVKSNRLCVSSLETRVSRKGKLFVKGNLPLKISELFPGDKIDLKCEDLEVRAKNILSGRVDSQIQITGSILQPNVSGMIKLSNGEASLPQDKGSGEASKRLASNRLSTGTGKRPEVEKKMEQDNTKPTVDVRLTDLKLLLGPKLRIVYPLILNFAVSGELELNGIAHPQRIKPKGILKFENGDVNLVATQVRLKSDHLNIAKFEPDLGLDPTLDLALVGSEWQFRIQGRASNWQDNLVVTSTRSVEQDVLSPTEAAKVLESQLAGSLLEHDGQLAFKKLATATLETLLPRIEGQGEFGQARWRMVYAPQIPGLFSLDPTVDPLKSLASISIGTEVEVHLGKRLQANVVRKIKDSEMSSQFTLSYMLTSRLRVLFHYWPSSESWRLLSEYSATSQD